MSHNVLFIWIHVYRVSQKSTLMPRRAIRQLMTYILIYMVKTVKFLWFSGKSIPTFAKLGLWILFVSLISVSIVKPIFRKKSNFNVELAFPLNGNMVFRVQSPVFFFFQILQFRCGDAYRVLIQINIILWIGQNFCCISINFSS